MKEFIEKLSKTLDEGGAYCIHCRIFFDDVIDARKHQIEQHYNYALAQCNGDKKRLLDSIKEDDGVSKN